VLKILEAQMDRLAEERQAAFVARMRPRLRERYPEVTAGASDEELGRLVEQGMAASRRYGIEGEGDVERYVDLMLELGSDFDRSVDWASEILNRPDFTGKIRIDVLCAAHEGRIPEEGMFFP
jgi:hypothetical protein